MTENTWSVTEAQEDWTTTTTEQRQTAEEDRLAEYLKAIDLLTILPENPYHELTQDSAVVFGTSISNSGWNDKP